ncbi:N-acetyl-alpha-D-glucosaminyl L-malate synthase [Roseibaca ekhonensis]|uniref:N-acetyl-alpha-D-glucosaminyl L-malate synthase n=1 Tax=Roseinatronobacter ekhonensis TaxID=254356 RepID=A0A3B0MVW8_9RHOB|nr:glycosyltransferase family 4 protein [Roseibaca ekhonensis]SUZ31966.1 N-acetyl-alpha-D-glucosaminyl L-malate synthase [Roseibaca ekhonensis]
MRILAISHESLLYGAPRSLIFACLHLVQRHKVRVLTHGLGDLVGFARDQGIDIDVMNACDRVPDTRRSRAAYRVEQAWLRVQRRLCKLARLGRVWREARGVDLVYVNTVLHSAPILAARLRGRPIVIHVREAENYLKPRGRALTRLSRMLGRARAVICVSEAVRKLVLEVPGTGLRPEQVHTVHNGIHAGQFRRDPAEGQALRARLGIAPDAPVVAFLGNMRPRKGLDLLMAAAQDLQDAHPDLHYIIGGGSAEDIAAFRAAHVPDTLAPRVHFLGFVQDVRPVLWAGDIFTMLSRVEPFARVNLEASAAGCAVLATRVDGNPEIFAHEDNALLVPSDDIAAIRDGLARLVSDPALRDRLSARAQAVVTERFTMDACHDRIETILTEAAQADRAAP